MNLKKVVTALSAVTMLGSMTVAVPVSAADETRVITPKWDIQLRASQNYNESYVSTEGALEINSSANDMCIGFYFDIPEVSGKYIKSATLRLTSERNKGATVSIYELAAADWSTDGKASYSGLNVSSKKVDPVATFSPAADGSKSIYYDAFSDEYKSIAKWQNNISLPVKNISQGNGYAILAANAKNENVQVKFFAKEASDFTKNDTSFYNADLIPKLTLVYADLVAAVTVDGTTTNYSSLDDAINAANVSSSDSIIELYADAQQTVKLSPKYAKATLNGNGHIISGSGTLYEAEPNDSKAITINNAVLNISGTSTSAPALATRWKTGSKIVLNNTTLNTDVVIYSTNGSTLAVTGNSTVNGTVYLYVGSYAAETSKYRTYLSLDGYTGSGVINAKLLYLDDPTGNHSNYAVGDYVANKANGKLDKINLIDNNYVLEMNSNNNGDVILKEKVVSAAIVKENGSDYITYQTGTDGSTAAGFFAELTATVGSIQKLGVKVDDVDRGSQYLSSDGETHTTLTAGTVYIPVIVKNVTDANTITLYVE